MANLDLGSEKIESASLWKEWRIVGIFTIYHNVNLNSYRKYNRQLEKDKKRKSHCRLEEVGLLENEERLEMDLRLLDRRRGVQREL